jgi:hypothetical protein
MFVQSKVVAALEQNADAFMSEESRSSDEIEALRRLLQMIAGWPREQLLTALAGAPFPGALPTEEHGRAGRPVIPFPLRWENHEQARAWALKVLRGRPTFAADGSQIASQRGAGMPAALAQVGWFENPHEAGAPYEKDLRVEVLPPELTRYATEDEGYIDSELAVSLRRYQLETERVTEYLRGHAGDPRRPVAFFDGSLVASFAARLPDDVRAAYLRATLTMLSASRQARVPLIGYVDTSFARDLVEMASRATAGRSPRASDAAVLRGLMTWWGDRSPACICARADGILQDYADAAGDDWRYQTAFVYLLTATDAPPARLEFPLWVLEDGRLDDVLDIVRAEVVVGNGYPYALETADALAVLSAEDREKFSATFQEFARRHDLPVRRSRKAQSKRQRRV